jgi:hypothetical protein
MSDSVTGGSACARRRGGGVIPLVVSLDKQTKFRHCIAGTYRMNSKLQLPLSVGFGGAMIFGAPRRGFESWTRVLVRWRISFAPSTEHR